MKMRLLVVSLVFVASEYAVGDYRFTHVYRDLSHVPTEPIRFDDSQMASHMAQVFVRAKMQQDAADELKAAQKASEVEQKKSAE